MQLQLQTSIPKSFRNVFTLIIQGFLCYYKYSSEFRMLDHFS